MWRSFCFAWFFFNLTSPCERVRANKLKPKVRHHVTELTVGQSQLWVFGQSGAEGHKHASPPQRKERKTDERKTDRRKTLSPSSNLNKSTDPSAKTASGMTTCSHRSKCSTLSVSRQALKVAVMTCWALNGAVCCRAAFDSPPASAALKPLALDATINLTHFTSLLLISPADAVCVRVARDALVSAPSSNRGQRKGRESTVERGGDGAAQGGAF